MVVVMVEGAGAIAVVAMGRVVAAMEMVVEDMGMLAVATARRWWRRRWWWRRWRRWWRGLCERDEHTKMCLVPFAIEVVGPLR